MSMQESVIEHETITFTQSRLPRLIVGENSILQLPRSLKEYGYRRTALITGGASYAGSQYRSEFETALKETGISFEHFQVSGEPAPEMVDAIRDACIDADIDSVLAVGGGSVIDAGKAVAAMMKHSGSVKDYLEGVGTRKPEGNRCPLAAVPATSGTGSEATMNAVISRVGEAGFKKSMRHEGFVPDIAVLDPRVTKSCPPEVTAASGMDALCQLLESYVSVKGTPFTDALALNGLFRIARALPAVMRDGNDLNARTQMAYASYLSGVCLANAGLGIVHGAASTTGSLRRIPHGVVCGTLLPSATETIVQALKLKEQPSGTGLVKYSRAAVALTGTDTGDHYENCSNLTQLLFRWMDQFNIPRLSEYGFTDEDLRAISTRSGLKGTPVQLSADDIYTILKARL